MISRGMMKFLEGMLFGLTDKSLAYYHHANTYRGQFIFMKLSSTHLADKPLFPLKNTLIDSFDDVLDNVRFDIDHDNQTDISIEQQTALSEIEALDQKLL